MGRCRGIPNEEPFLLQRAPDGVTNLAISGFPILPADSQDWEGHSPLACNES